jgi:hypothetical protein
MSAYGFVYLLGNAVMPCCYKIGRTDYSPYRRAAELSSGTGVPHPYQVLCYIEVSDSHAVERDMHDFLGDFRINPGREFFRFAPAQMPWLHGIFKHHPERSAYAECEIWEYAPHNLPEENPWSGGGDRPEMTPIEPMGFGALRLVA